MDEYWVAIVPHKGQPYFSGPLSYDRASVVVDHAIADGCRASIIGRP